MAKPLKAVSVAAPGFYGLNTQESGVTLPPNFAYEATNCVIDKFGRIGARKGWTKVNASTNVDLGTNKIQTIYEIVKEDGNVVISGGNNKLFTGRSTLTTATVRDATNSADLTYTITDNHWQIAALPYDAGLNASSHAYLVQGSHPTLIYHKLGATGHAHTGSYGFQRLADIGTLPIGFSASTFTPNCALAAYGRVWYADITGDKQTVYFSDLLNGDNLRTGSAGSLNIATVVPNNDPIVALAAHNNFLIIFCKRNVVLYSGADDPATLSLSDIIKGIGCIARDSVQNTGTDIIFLSDTGVRSLLRVIQEKSLPFRDLSKNVRDDLMGYVNSETSKLIKSAYSPNDAFYVLALPTSGLTYVFDMRTSLEDGSARVTTWNNISPNALCVTEARELLIGKLGYIGKYGGYADDAAVYRMVYYTSFFDFSEPTLEKILKKINIVVFGGASQSFVTKWGYDYGGLNYNQTLSLLNSTVAQYGISEYNTTAEYAGSEDINSLIANGLGYGKVLQLGFEVDIQNSSMSIQKFEVFVKSGRTI